MQEHGVVMTRGGGGTRGVTAAVCAIVHVRHDHRDQQRTAAAASRHQKTPPTRGTTTSSSRCPSLSSLNIKYVVTDYVEATHARCVVGYTG